MNVNSLKFSPLSFGSKHEVSMAKLSIRDREDLKTDLKRLDKEKGEITYYESMGIHEGDKFVPRKHTAMVVNCSDDLDPDVSQIMDKYRK